MTDFEKKYNLSLTDINKVQKRIASMIEMAANTMDSLGRAADNCWEYPGADEKYEELSAKMIKLEKKQAKLDEISNDIKCLIEKFENLES